MKLIVLSLLAFVSTTLAQTTQAPTTQAPTTQAPFMCYTCIKETCDESDLAPCLLDNAVCQTTTITTPKVGIIDSITTYTHSCTTKSLCTASDSSLSKTTCCDTSECNKSAGATVKVSIVAMLVAVLLALWARN